MSNSLLRTSGCFRYQNGTWIPGYSKFIGRGFVLQAELWAIILGFDLAVHMNFGSNLEIETNSKQTLHLFTDSQNIFHPLDSLISNCRYWFSSFSNVKLSQVAKRQNICADILAKEGRKGRLPLTIYEAVLAFLSKTYLDDLAILQHPLNTGLWIFCCTFVALSRACITVSFLWTPFQYLFIMF